MWLSPWDNSVHGGDQLADSLWAYATGGATGMGTGRGDAQLVPAAHTDLILSALGEEWGFAGVAAIFALYGLLVWPLTAHRVAAPANDYEFFLAAALSVATALPISIDRRGSLGVLPLSGVVTPFLSYGRTAMLANFASSRCCCRFRIAARSRRPPRHSGRHPHGGRDFRGGGRGGAGQSRLRASARSAAIMAKAHWSFRPMADAATSTIRASRK